ncbi:MAG: gfo/Idh/MocA family oxidoreductase [Candidatus Aenigmatarchaeota archaeon]|nr:MAG: gfo/Idh/MocA family oxidoreductase [Candidatus Aenigmarchaeota archaeon]
MVKVAVIGTGNMGRHHARVYSELGESELVAVTDINKRKGKQIAKKFKCKFYSDYKTMLKNESVDAVSVAVPTFLHKEVSLGCIEEGKHVLVEKPIAKTLEDAKTIINYAKKKKIKLAVGHTERFNPAVQKLKELIQKNRLGKIITISAKRVGLLPPQIRDANVIIDIAVHDIDVFNYLLEKKPTKIYATAGKALIAKREDYADILMKYDGTNAFIQVNWVTPVKIRTLSVTGIKGYAELNYMTQDLFLFKSDWSYIREKTFTDIKKLGTPKKKRIKIQKEEPLKRELRSFLNWIKTGKKHPCTGKEGLLALETAYKVIESYKKSEPVI